MRSDHPVAIIGAGLSGLACARTLYANSVPFLLIEASDAVGGRVRTDRLDGFLLDRGFQVLLTAYPEASAVLDYERLQLNCFEPGARIHVAGRLYRFADPWRQPARILQTALSPIGTLTDKLKVGKLRASSRRGELETLFQRTEKTAAEELAERRFSKDIVTGFFKPFLGGVFLDPELKTSNRMLHFVFRMFSEGYAALPANGMQAIPDQLASGLPSETIRLNRPVSGLSENCIEFRDGERINFHRLVVATDDQVAARLVPELSAPPEPRSVCCIYFAAEKPPVDDPVLVLNGNGTGLVNHLAVLDRVAPTYAPPGASLISVTVLGNPALSQRELCNAIRDRIGNWFGSQVADWRHLKTYRVTNALPASPPSYEPKTSPRIRDGVYACGDYCTNASIDGALRSGRLTAEAVLNDL